MRGRQIFSSDGDDAIDITLSLGKPFKNGSERISCTELVVRPGRSQRPYFLPGSSASLRYSASPASPRISSYASLAP